MTWKELREKYPEIESDGESREYMTTEREKAFVNDCFLCYETEGFAKEFWSPYSKNEERKGQHFEVTSRCTTEDCDLDSLPMWHIRFADGTTMCAYPEEIILSEMKKNGYILENIK